MPPTRQSTVSIVSRPSPTSILNVPANVKASLLQPAPAQAQVRHVDFGLSVQGVAHLQSSEFLAWVGRRRNSCWLTRAPAAAATPRVQARLDSTRWISQSGEFHVLLLIGANVLEQFTR